MYIINTLDIWQKSYGVDGGVDIQVNKNPNQLTQSEWERLSEWVEGNFPLTAESRSHGLSQKYATYNFEGA